MPRLGSPGIWALALGLGLSGPLGLAAQETPPPAPSQAIEVVGAPELDGGVGWFNVARPLRLADLHGKVVLLDFWTYGCINCLHVIPDLKRLEAKYGPALVVIGVHSAKFANEGESERLRQAILRYGRQHPVVNDRDFRIWRAYSVRAWPTLIVIDADGDLIGGVEGEGHGEGLDRVIGILVADARVRGVLDERPLPLALERHRLGPTILSFPGKVLADPDADRLFIADTNHNRIVLARRDGQVLETIGGPDPGLRDGGFAEARFDHPQGMALHRDALYVADRENHAIRKLDLGARTVTTVAGTGRQGQVRAGGGPARSIGLSSPWDLIAVRDTLYVAMAGAHQLWALDLASGEIRPHAGAGSEGVTDGPLARAELAQPSGIATDGARLYVADSEASAIRSADLDLSPTGRVGTLVGTGLFDFGDVDGEGDAVRLQHPLGVAVHAGRLYVADTYNHKVKVIEPGARRATTLLGDGTPGHAVGAAARFFEPGGLSVAEGKLYVADTNNHAIRVADLATRRVSTLVLRDLAAPPAAAADLSDVLPDTPRLALAPAAVQSDGAGALLLDIRLPPGYKLAPGTAVVYRVRQVTGVDVLAGERERTLENASLPIRVPFSVGRDAGEAHLTVSATFFYCRSDGQGVCLVEAAIFEQPLRVAADAAGREVRIMYEPPGPPR